jgi:hypothetical protein
MITTTTAPFDTTAHSETTAMLSSLGLRFLLRHRLGRLVTEDLITGQTFITPVHYVMDPTGGLVTLLPADSAHAAALAGGRTVSILSVHGEIPPNLDHIAGARSDASPVWHVQAEVETQVVSDLPGIRSILARQIHAVLADLPQADKSDPLHRASPSDLAAMLGLRLTITGLRAHSREYATLAA